MWIKRLTAVAGLMLLVGCTPSGSESTATISPAAKAPVSDFTISCPTFDGQGAGNSKNTLPLISLECLGSEGDPVTMSGKPPRPLVLNFWASWCGPCLEEMPVINDFATLAHGKVDVLGVATNNARSQATAFAVEMKLTFPSVLDPKAKVVGDLGLAGLPTTVLVDADGKVVNRFAGTYKSVDQLKADVQKYLGVTL